MWLDSKAVNCPQKWGNFSWSQLRSVGAAGFFVRSLLEHAEFILLIGILEADA